MIRLKNLLKVVTARVWIIILFLLISVESIICSWLLFRIPGNSRNALFAGLSLPRLILTGILISGFIISVVISYRLIRNKAFSFSFINYINRYHRRLSIIFGFSTALMWLAVFLPTYRLGIYFAYFERLKPFFVWFLLVSIQAFLFLTREHLRKRGALHLEENDYRLVILSGIIFLCFSAILLFVSITRWGISPTVEFWEKTGVPILAAQIFVTWLLGIGLISLRAGIKVKKSKQKIGRIHIDLLFFLVIWVISAALWVSEPLQFNHFNPGPFPPNYQFYPNSDAETYDLAAQKALIGKYPGYVDKPFYSTLLLGFHLVAGQNTNRIIEIQTALLAIFPALIYLLGTRLQNRVGGLLAALLANFKEINAIRAQALIWKTSTPKLMMSEFTNAVLLALIVLLLWKWFSQEKKLSLSALSTGGVLGLAVLTRHNNWLFLPLIILLAVLKLWKQKKILLINGILFITMFFSTIGPWMWYSNQHYGQPLPFMNALKGAVLKNRINPLLDQSAPTPTPKPETFQPSGQFLKTASSNVNNIYTQITSNLSRDTEISESDIILHPVIDAITRHFFHNLVSTALTLPVTPVFDDLETSIRSSEVALIWQLEWNGKLKLHQLLLLVINLILVSIGVAQSWQRWQLAGLIPLIILLGYLFATAIATTSGGRYIVPADWVIYVYYALGVVQFLEFFTDKVWKIAPSITQFYNAIVIDRSFSEKIWPQGAIAGLFILLGFLPVFGMSGFPQKYPEYTQPEIIENVLKQNASQDQEEFTPLITAVEQGKLKIIFGRMLNPKYLDYQDDFSFEVNVAGGNKGIPSLVFNVIGMQEDFLHGQLAMDEAPPPLPNGSDAVVFTCPDLKTAYALILLDKDNYSQIFLHSDWPRIDCPEP